MPGRVNGRENSGGSGLPEEKKKLICGPEEEIVVAHGRLTSPALPVGWPVPINSYNTCSTFCTSFFLKGTESVILMDPPCKDDNAITLNRPQRSYTKTLPSLGMEKVTRRSILTISLSVLLFTIPRTNKYFFVTYVLNCEESKDLTFRGLNVLFLTDFAFSKV